MNCSLHSIPITHTETKLCRKRTSNIQHWIYSQEYSQHFFFLSFSSHQVTLYRYFGKSYTLWAVGDFIKTITEWKLANNFILVPKQEYIDFFFFFPKQKTVLYWSWRTVWILTELRTCFLFPFLFFFFYLWSQELLKDRIRDFENSSL